MTKEQATKDLAAIEQLIERTVASVHGVLTAADIEKRDSLRRFLGIEAS